MLMDGLLYNDSFYELIILHFLLGLASYTKVVSVNLIFI